MKMPQLKEKVTDYFYNLDAVLVKPQHFCVSPKRTKTGNYCYCVRHFCHSVSGNCQSWIFLNGELISNNETTWKMEVGVGLRGNQKDCWNAKFWGHAKQMLHYDQFVCSFRAKIGVVTYQDRMSSQFGKVLTIQPFIYELTICKHL